MKEPKIFELSELQQLCAQSIELSYNVNAADTLELSLKPEAYAELALVQGDRIILNEGRRKVFSGYVLEEPTRMIQAGAGEVVTVSAASDWALLERTVWAKQLNNKKFIYPSNGKPGEFVNAVEHINEVLEWAKGKPDTPIVVDSKLGGRIQNVEVPRPEMSGICNCADIISECMSWMPYRGIVQRYGTTDTLHIADWTTEDSCVLDEDSLLTSINLTRKTPPTVHALVGGDHYVLPEDGDIREPGAFVYAVPFANDPANAPAGGAPASQKSELKGVALPERAFNERTRHEWVHVELVTGSRTERFVRRFFPQYVPFLGKCMTGAAVASIVSREDMRADAEADAEEGEKVEIAANYSDTPQNWAGAGEQETDISSGVYVLTEGSFAASADSTKNLRGLRWCKAKVEMQIVIRLKDVKAMSAELRELATELFPAKFKMKNKDGVYETRRSGKLVLDCVLVNARKRVFDPATNKPFPSDAEWQEEDSENPTRAEYRRALDLYRDFNEPFFEGEVELLYEPEASRFTVYPEQVTMQQLMIIGKRPEWDETLTSYVLGCNWSYGERKLSLRVGRPEIQGFDAVLQKLVLQRQARQAATQRLVLPFDTLDKEAQEDAERSLTVSPSIAASVATVTAGNSRKPWRLYSYTNEDGKEVIMLAGGTLARNGQKWNVPDSEYQFERGEQNAELTWDLHGTPPKLTWDVVNGQLTWNITQKPLI